MTIKEVSDKFCRDYKEGMKLRRHLGRVYFLYRRPDALDPAGVWAGRAEDKARSAAKQTSIYGQDFASAWSGQPYRMSGPAAIVLASNGV